MTLRIDRLFKGAAASTVALTMFVGCNTFEGMGEDVADAGEAVQSIGDDRSDRVEVVSSERRDSDWNRQIARSDRADVNLQAQQHQAGLFAANGDRINALERQQMASRQMQQRPQQLTDRTPDQRDRLPQQDRSTDVFGFAEDTAAQNQQKISGTIQDVARIPHITVRTDDGREVIALLNQAQSEQIRKLEQGKKVTLNGAMREHEGRQVFVVQSIQEVRSGQTDRQAPNAQRDREQNQALGFVDDQNARQRAAAEHRNATERSGDAQQHADKAHKKHVLVGTVQKIEEIKGEKGPHLMVKSDKGDKTYRVDLTGVEEAKLLKKEINEGDKVTLIGSIVKGHAQQQPGQDQAQQQPGQDQAQANAQQPQLFKADKLHKGVVAEVVQTYAFVGEGEELRGKLSNYNAQAEAGASANVMSQDGRTVKVDLSKIDRAKLQGLQNEQSVIVMGSLEQKDGQQVFVATDIKQDAQQGQQQQERDQPRQEPNQERPAAPQPPQP